MISKRNDSVAVEFDQSGLFRAEIQDRLDDLKRVCKKYSIPMFASFLIANGGGETKYANEVLTPSFINRNGIYDDKISEYMKVVLGYRTVKESTRKVVNEDGTTVFENDFDAVMELTNSIHEGQFEDENADLAELDSLSNQRNLNNGLSDTSQEYELFDLDICMDQIEGEVNAYR